MSVSWCLLLSGLQSVQQWQASFENFNDFFLLLFFSKTDTSLHLSAEPWFVFWLLPQNLPGYTKTSRMRLFTGLDALDLLLYCYERARHEDTAQHSTAKHGM